MVKFTSEGSVYPALCIHLCRVIQLKEEQCRKSNQRRRFTKLLQLQYISYNYFYENLIANCFILSMFSYSGDNFGRPLSFTEYTPAIFRIYFKKFFCERKYHILWLICVVDFILLGRKNFVQ